MVTKNTATAFKFTIANIKKSKEIIAKYPAGRQKSAILPLLDLAQRQNNGHLSKEAIERIAVMLSLAPIRVYEVASFYTMFNLNPVGKYHVQVCTTTPCWLMGSSDVLKACEKELDIKSGQTTKDKMFTLREVECLGACVNAPVVQINDDYHENLDAKSMHECLKKLKKKEK